MGFKFELVSADSLYGESKVNFVNALDELKLPYILAIHSNHGLWLPQDQQTHVFRRKLSPETLLVYGETWQTFTRTLEGVIHRSSTAV